MLAWGAVAVAAMLGGYAASAYVSGNAPFHSDPYFGRGQVLRALPADFPAPPQSRVDGAGPGSHLPYRVEWRSDAPVSAVAGVMRQQLDDGTWRIVDSSNVDGTLHLRSTRGASGGDEPVVAEDRGDSIG